MDRERKMNPERGHWKGKYDFVFSALGFAVGLGNIWKFPYLCYLYGGGAFLLPYTFMLFFVGIPMFLLLLAIGQFSALTPTKCYSNMAPLFLGCYSETEKRICRGQNESNVYFNGSCFDVATAERKGISEIFPGERISGPKNSKIEISRILGFPTASEEYMNHRVLGITSGLEDLGGLQWRLVVYFTATFPYVVMLALLVRGVTLPGAVDGIRFYMVPRWDKVTNIKVEFSLAIFLKSSIVLQEYI
ncbi:unnamed protein product [Darwinula stevensoni]|uniref:Transporter n=1 Tax=Darwinula stevensoni TaxID=69355 RepID=A0A7R8XAK4_9CRUS|nr:unnamed protein product [Darwinula stevensoni]CAG0886798.1 unnamed protein product [Darwinula stevensoni]